MYYGNYTAFFIDLNAALATVNLSTNFFPPSWINLQWMNTIRSETISLIQFYVGIGKSFGYPFGLMLQILAVIFLVRGNSGYSRSARNWFLLVLGSDIGSTLYRVYDLITVDFAVSNPIFSKDKDAYFGQQFAFLMWGLRRMEDRLLQDALCRSFFIVLYFPIHLSPIALTVSGVIRCYCVKFPLKAKATLTTRVDRCLVAFTVLLSLAISVIIGALASRGWSNPDFESAFGMAVHYGDCPIARYDYANTNKDLLYVGVMFMLSIIFIICAFNFLAAVLIIIVLFEAKRNRKSMSANEGTDSSAEVRATAMLLGMNLTLFICFFVSRLMLVSSTRMNYVADPVGYAVLDRFSSYLFNIPYYTNTLFIVGLSSKFYEFYLPCLAKKKEMKTTSAVSQKTMEESKMG